MSNTALNRTIVALLTNKSGGAHAQGDVCVIDNGTASSVEDTTTSGFVNGQIAVCIEPNGVANNATGLYATGGYIPKINLSGSASLGDVFKTHTVAKQAVRHAPPLVAGDFGIVLEASATPKAILFGMPNQGTVSIMDLIAEVTPTGVGTVTVASSIVATYKKLVMDYAIRSTQAANAVDGYLQFNNDTTAANYRHQLLGYNPFGATNTNGANYIFAKSTVPGSSAPSSEFCIGKIEIVQYANANINKVANIQLGAMYDASLSLIHI